MNDHDYTAQYGVLSDKEITQLASEGGLLPEADASLRAEMHKRSIGATQVRSLRVEQADERRGITMATRWIVFAYMPLNPIGSYRVKEFGGSANPQIVGRVRLQWDQV